MSFFNFGGIQSKIKKVKAELAEKGVIAYRQGYDDASRHIDDPSVVCVGGFTDSYLKQLYLIGQQDFTEGRPANPEKVKEWVGLAFERSLNK